MIILQNAKKMKSDLTFFITILSCILPLSAMEKSSKEGSLIARAFTRVASLHVSDTVRLSEAYKSRRQQSKRIWDDFIIHETEADMSVNKAYKDLFYRSLKSVEDAYKELLIKGDGFKLQNSLEKRKISLDGVVKIKMLKLHREYELAAARYFWRQLHKYPCSAMRYVQNFHRLFRYHLSMAQTYHTHIMSCLNSQLSEEQNTINIQIFRKRFLTECRKMSLDYYRSCIKAFNPLSTLNETENEAERLMCLIDAHYAEYERQTDELMLKVIENNIVS